VFCVKYFYDLPTRAKLIIGFGLALFMTVLVGLVGTVNCFKVRAAGEEIAQKDVARLQALVEVTSAGGWMRRAAINMGNAIDAKSGQKSAKRFDEAKAAYEEAYSKIAHMITAQNERAVLAELDQAKAAYVAADDANRALAWVGRLDEFRSVVNKEGRSTFAVFDEKLKALSAAVKQTTASNLAESDRVYRTSLVMMALATFVSALVCFSFALLIGRHVLNQVNALTARLGDLAERELPVHRASLEALSRLDLSRKVESSLRAIEIKHKDDLSQIAISSNRVIEELSACSLCTESAREKLA